jgi:membrane protease YdiL (CAAX protease family)
VFGLFHIDPGAIVPTFALGLALGWVYLKTGSIWPAIFAHGLHNTVAVLVAKYGNIT